MVMLARFDVWHDITLHYNLIKTFFKSDEMKLERCMRLVVGGFLTAKTSFVYNIVKTYVTMNKESPESDIRNAAQLSSSTLNMQDELLRICLRVDNDFTPTSLHREAAAKKRQCRLSASKRQLYKLSKNTTCSIYHLIQTFSNLYRLSEPKKTEKEPSISASYNNREFQSPIQRYFKKNGIRIRK